MYYCIMYSFETSIRVRYSETDQMGFVYYGVYSEYLEVGRVELLRSVGISYKELEELGFALPVVSLNINYKKPAYYDDIIIITTIIKQLPDRKITFFYETRNQKGELLNTADTVLVFINKQSNKVCNVPEFVLNKLKDIML